MRFDFQNDSKERKIYSVSELNQEARGLLESNFDGVWLEAEVSDVSKARSGHIYFSLADPGGKAGISAVMWQGMAMRYESRIKAGAAVRCHGRVTLYEARGSYQIVVDRVEDAGAGKKALDLAILKDKLEKEGLFKLERKRPLPRFPRCVGVVTSRDGAALRDIIKVAHSRFPITIKLAHAQVQGSSAPEEIAGAIALLEKQQDVDVIIVGRGGGSAEDLEAFNAEIVVRAAAACRVTVVSAVGHEVDFSLLDLAADRRAATPTEAAQIAVPDSDILVENIIGLEKAAKRAFFQSMATDKEILSRLERRLHARDPRVSLRRGIEVIARAKNTLEKWPKLALSRAQVDLANAERPLGEWSRNIIAVSRENLFELTTRLNAISPLACLARGYAVVRETVGNTILRDASSVLPGTEVDITLQKGRLLCDVKSTS